MSTTFKDIVKILNEGANFDFKTAISEIAELTDENQHSEALTLGAKTLYDYTEGTDDDVKDLIDDFKNIQKEHMKKGELTFELSKKRSECSTKLFELAKKWLSPAEFKAFKAAY